LPPHLAPTLAGLFAALSFGVTTPLSKGLLDQCSPLGLSGLLYAGAAMAVAPWAARDWPRGVDLRNVARLGGAVAFGGVVGPVLLLIGLASSSATEVSLWLNLETVATALLARWFFREQLSGRTWVSVALVIAGSALLTSGGLEVAWAAAWVAGACLAWGLDNNLTSVIDRFTPAQVTFVKGLGAAIVNLSAETLSGGHWPNPGTIALALLVGAFGYGASLMAYVASARELGATRSQLLFSTAPAWGLLACWTVLGEPVRALDLAAAALMAVAVWLWHGEVHAHRHRHRATRHHHAHRHDDGHHAHSHAVMVPATLRHSHLHRHEPLEHTHAHRPDLHHRHEH